MAPNKKSNKSKRDHSPEASPSTSKRAAPTSNAFPTRSIGRILESHFPGRCVTPGAVHFLGTFLQHLGTEMIEQSVHAARDRVGTFQSEDEELLQVKTEDVDTVERRDPEMREVIHKTRKS